MKALTVVAEVALGLIASVACAQTISPMRLVEISDLSAPMISPDGRSVAFRVERASVARNTYDSVWYVQDMDGKVPPRKVGEGGVPLRNSAGVPVSEAARWSPDGRYIYYRALLEDRVDVWRARADGSGAGPVTLDSADVREFVLGDDGRTLRYSVGATRDAVTLAEQDEYDRGIRIDGSVPVGASLFRSSFFGGRLATQRYSGAWFERGPLLADVPDRWRELDPESGAVRELEPAEAAAFDSVSLDLPENMPTPSLVDDHRETGRVAMVTPHEQNEADARTDHARVSVLMEGRAGQVVECRADPCLGSWITGVKWHPGGDDLLFTVTSREEGLAQSIYRWSIASGEVRQVVWSTGLLSGGRDYRSDCGVSADYLACITAAAEQPPRLERIDIRTGRRSVLFDPNTALAADLPKAVSTRLVRWEDEEGTEFSGQLFTARGEAALKRPLFITYYFCPGFVRGGLGDEWPLASLAELGISALCINTPPFQPDPVARYDKGLMAIETIVEQLASEGVIDPSRVGMGGLSFGSEMAMWAAVETDLLAAVSVTAPSASPLYALISSLKGDAFTTGMRRNWGLGSVDETPDQWRRVSPAFNTDRIQAPVLFQMPEEEYIYGLDYIIPLINNQLADLYVFPDEAHQKFQPRHKLAAYERNIDWFRFWLQGFEEQSPGKADQYKNWRELRPGSARYSDVPADDLNR